MVEAIPVGALDLISHPYSPPLSLCSRALGPANTTGSYCSEDWRWVCSDKPHQSLEVEERNFILTRTYLEGWSSWALRNWCSFFPRHRVYYWGFFLLWRRASLLSPPSIPLFPTDSWHFIREFKPRCPLPTVPCVQCPQDAQCTNSTFCYCDPGFTSLSGQTIFNNTSEVCTVKRLRESRRVNGCGEHLEFPALESALK